MMNVGKILVPSDVLTRTEALGEAELQQIRNSIQASAELLQGVEFDGPVVETLRQLQENWDGSGAPRGLAGEEILLPARIVSVANAFVAMISPRAWRPAPVSMRPSIILWPAWADSMTGAPLRRWSINWIIAAPGNNGMISATHRIPVANSSIDHIFPS
jgi:hypothetical protein